MMSSKTTKSTFTVIAANLGKLQFDHFLDFNHLLKINVWDLYKSDWCPGPKSVGALYWNQNEVSKSFCCRVWWLKA